MRLLVVRYLQKRHARRMWKAGRAQGFAEKNAGSNSVAAGWMSQVWLNTFEKRPDGKALAFEQAFSSAVEKMRRDGLSHLLTAVESAERLYYPENALLFQVRQLMEFIRALSQA